MGKESQAQAVERARERIRLKGADAAVTALIAACEDPTTPVTAKVQAGTTLLRAAGLFEKGSPEDLEGKELYELSGAELDAMIAQLQADLAARQSQQGPVFE